MESYKIKMFNDFISNSIKYESLLFKEKKISAEESVEKNKEIFISMKTENIKTSQKDQLALEKEIENKWNIVIEAFELIKKANSITITEYKDFVAELNKWIGKKNSNMFLIYKKKEITFDTEINESIMLNIFIEEIENLFRNLLNLDPSELTEFPFVNLLQTKYYIISELKSIFSNVFNGKNSPKKELLKILKIDYFQKCINDKIFDPDSLTSILSLQEDNLRILDLNNHYLPFSDEGKLLSYSKFLQTMFESETYLEGMRILMNAQIKNNLFTTKEIKESMSEIYKYLFHPIVFPNKEVTKLYGITCINLNVYLSSFVIDNIDKEIDQGYKNGVNDLERINKLKGRSLSKISTGVKFYIFIMTILHESAHVLRRHLVEPKVYIDTEEMDKEVLIQEIKDVKRKENKNSISQTSLTINEGGDMLDYIFFGGTLYDLVAEEVRYIFDLENWKNDMKTFRNEFITIRDKLKTPLKVSKALMIGNPTGKGPWKCGSRKSVPY